MLVWELVICEMLIYGIVWPSFLYTILISTVRPSACSYRISGNKIQVTWGLHVHSQTFSSQWGQSDSNFKMFCFFCLLSAVAWEIPGTPCQNFCYSEWLSEKKMNFLCGEHCKKCWVHNEISVLWTLPSSQTLICWLGLWLVHSHSSEGQVTQILNFYKCSDSSDLVPTISSHGLL